MVKISKKKIQESYSSPEKSKWILGFDEINNGYNLDDPEYKRSKNSPLIVVGYLYPDIGRANYGSGKYEGAKKLFNSNRDLKRAYERGSCYIKENPDFLYTLISGNHRKKTPIHILKGNAVALLSFKFFLNYGINPRKTKIIMDEMNGRDRSNFVNLIVGAWLEKSGINMFHRYKRYADKNTIAVKKAHTVARYLAAIHFFSDYHHWPYHRKKVNLSELENLCVEVHEKILDNKKFF